MNCWPRAAADEVTVALNSSMRSEPCVSYTCTELTSSGATTNLQIGLELAHRLRKAIENRELCCPSQDILRARELAYLQSQLAASSLLKLRALRFQRHTTSFSRNLVLHPNLAARKAMRSAANFPRKKRPAISDFTPERKRTIYDEAHHLS
jgi:hypothetical protein